MLAMKIQVTGVDSAVDSLKRSAEKHVRDQAALLHTSLVEHTPIDKGGARAGWKTSVTGNRIESVNQVPYIQRLENNWSKQTRGKGIIGPSLQAFNRGKSK
jgi:hypothetical protein